MTNSTYYNKVAKIINNTLLDYKGMGLNPEVKVLDRGEDGLLIILNDDCYDLAQYKGKVQDMFYAGETFVVGDYDFYLEPFDSHMAYKLSQ